jgi:peroxiredoxin
MKVALPLALLLLAAYPAIPAKKAAIEASNAKTRNLLGNPAPDFTLPDFDGQPFSLAEHRNQVVVLAFWATWCPPCRAEMPMFARLQNELAPQGVVITPIAFDDPAAAKDFLAKKKLNVRSLSDGAPKDGGRVSALFGAHVLPKTVVIDRNGIVVKAILGKASESELRAAIQAALK